MALIPCVAACRLSWPARAARKGRRQTEASPAAGDLSRGTSSLCLEKLHLTLHFLKIDRLRTQLSVQAKERLGSPRSDLLFYKSEGPTSQKTRPFYYKEAIAQNSSSTATV
jgi:hypothetical protein